VKHYLVLLWCLLFSTPAIAQTPAWKSYAIDQRLIVRFPVAPQELDVPQTMAANNSPNKDEPQVLAAQAFRAEDAVANYILVSIPIADTTYFLQPTSARDAHTKSRSIPLMMAQTHGELLEQTVSTQPGLDSFTVKFRVLTPDGSPSVKYARVLTVKQRIYQLYFLPKDKSGKIGTAERAQFFDAVVLAKKVNNQWCNLARNWFPSGRPVLKQSVPYRF